MSILGRIFGRSQAFELHSEYGYYIGGVHLRVLDQSHLPAPFKRIALPVFLEGIQEGFQYFVQRGAQQWGQEFLTFLRSLKIEILLADNHRQNDDAEWL